MRASGRYAAAALVVALAAAVAVVLIHRPATGAMAGVGTAVPDAARTLVRDNPAPPASPAPPARFTGTVVAIPAAIQAELTGVSWRPGCPVPLARLRLVQLTFWGFDAAAHQGELVVHEDVARAIVRIFERLYDARFPIRQMRRIDAYGGSDDASMAADNTSMFNCRNAYGSKNWSVHAYGKAIDINTVENPYLPGKNQVLPAAGAAYLDRRAVRPGMIVAGDVVVRAFAAEGFRWGAAWQDYQHFEIGP